MRKFSILLGLLVSLSAFTGANAQQPLQADLNPALYAPNVTYYDAGSGQNFYYDSATGQFMITGQATAPAMTTTNAAVTPTSATVALVTNAAGYGTGIDYAACYAKAAQIARGGVLSHLGYVVGAFEGIGMGGSPNCDTCVPGSAMTLSGDASVQGANGLWYRVRAWR